MTEARRGTKKCCTGASDGLLTLQAFSGATTVDAAIRGVTGSPVMIQDRAGSQMAASVNFTGPTAVAPSTTVRSAADRESIGIPAPSLRPPTDPGASFAPSSREADTPTEPAVPADAMMLFWERAGATDDTSDEAGEDAAIPQGDSYPVANSAAAVALVFGLAGWAAQPTEKESEKESRKRQQRLVDCI